MTGDPVQGRKENAALAAVFETGSIIHWLSNRSLSMPLSHRTTKTVAKGREYPLGATVVDGGVNFALYSRNASAVYLLLFDQPNEEPTDVIQLQCRDKFIWHVEVRGVG